MIRTSSVYLSWYLFVKGAFSTVNLSKSATMNLLAFLRLWKSLFVQVYSDLSIIIFVNIFRSHFDISVVRWIATFWCNVLKDINIPFCVFLCEIPKHDHLDGSFYSFCMSQIAWCCYLLGKFSPRRWKIMFLYPSV